MNGQLVDVLTGFQAPDGRQREDGLAQEVIRQDDVVVPDGKDYDCAVFAQTCLVYVTAYVPNQTILELFILFVLFVCLFLSTSL